MATETPLYGTEDTTYQAAGGEEGIRQLVDTFYDIMGSDPTYGEIWSWHPQDKALSRDKLARFLCAWTGGPRLYSEKYGPISIPKVHAHLQVGPDQFNQWLGCMAEALRRCGYPLAFQQYMLEQLAVPAQRIVDVCSVSVK